jgi:hypothetical protein
MELELNVEVAASTAHHFNDPFLSPTFPPPPPVRRIIALVLPQTKEDKRTVMCPVTQR